MGERGEDEGGAVEAKPVPEGAQRAQSAAQREELPPFRGQSVRASSLDLLVDLDEPEQVVRELRRLAERWPHDQKWGIVAKLCASAEATYELLNKPKGG